MLQDGIDRTLHFAEEAFHHGLLAAAEDDVRIRILRQAHGELAHAGFYCIVDVAEQDFPWLFQQAAILRLRGARDQPRFDEPGQDFPNIARIRVQRLGNRLRRLWLWRLADEQKGVDCHGKLCIHVLLLFFESVSFTDT